jgi:protein-tyrosine phosphatase
MRNDLDDLQRRRRGVANHVSFPNRPARRLPRVSLLAVSNADRDNVVDQRQLAFTGASNFRDLGGYPTDTGGQTRWAQVYRSDSLHSLSAEGLTTFAALGFTAIYDLRRADECEREPSPLPCVNLELPSGNVFDTDSTTLRTREQAQRWLIEDHCAMLAHAGTVFGRIFAELADPSCRPVVVHSVGEMTAPV